MVVADPHSEGLPEPTVYQHVAWWVMSGTGNSLRAAQWLAQTATEGGATSSIHALGPERPHSVLPDQETSLLGLCFPTHGFTAPWNVLRAVLRAPGCHHTHAVVVATRAGVKLGPLFLPGLEGTAAYLVALILALKGYSVRGVLGLDMPSNWMSLHPGHDRPASLAIIQRAQCKTRTFARCVLAGARSFSVQTLLCLLLGVALLPLSVGYLLVGRLFLAKLFFANGHCNGCGLCAEHCPVQAILMSKGTQPRPFWTFDCESCMRCMGYCPHQAIEAGHSIGVIYYLLTGPATVALLAWAASHVPAFAWLVSSWLSVPVGYALMIITIAVAYRLLAVMLRVPWLNWLFTHTTFTVLFRRYHEPDTRLAQLTRALPPPAPPASRTDAP